MNTRDSGHDGADLFESMDSCVILLGVIYSQVLYHVVPTVRSWQ
jgi:hypothetical protein